MVVALVVLALAVVGLAVWVAAAHAAIRRKNEVLLEVRDVIRSALTDLRRMARSKAWARTWKAAAKRSRMRAGAWEDSASRWRDQAREAQAKSEPMRKFKVRRRKGGGLEFWDRSVRRGGWRHLSADIEVVARIRHGGEDWGRRVAFSTSEGKIVTTDIPLRSIGPHAHSGLRKLFDLGFGFCASNRAAVLNEHLRLSTAPVVDEEGS